jgi:hypothetical protein
MELRLPGSGTLGEFLGGAIVAGLTPGDGAHRQHGSDRSYYSVTPKDVVSAIDLVASRSIEYVGLVDGDVEIQAGDVPGGFEFSRILGGEFMGYPTTLSLDETRAAFLAFLDGDVDCGLRWPEPSSAPERKKRGLFRRG